MLLYNSLQMAKKAAPAPAVSTNACEGLVGYDIETGGLFDPLGFGRNCPPEQMQWYRAAELKHGRVCMLAALGQITQHFTHWNDPSGIFDNSGSAWGAMQQVRSLPCLVPSPVASFLSFFFYSHCGLFLGSTALCGSVIWFVCVVRV